MQVRHQRRHLWKGDSGYQFQRVTGTGNQFDDAYVRAPDKLGVMKIQFAKTEIRSREESTDTHPHQKDLGVGSDCVVV